MSRLTFWFEFASTYSYLSAMRIEEACAARDVDLIWRPFLLGPVFAAQGWHDSPFNIFPAKGAYMWRDMERTTSARGLRFEKPARFPQNGLLAARIATAHAKADWLPDFVRSVYVANFADGQDISDREMLTDILARLPVDPEPVFQKAQEPATKAMLRQATDDAMRQGLFGAPSFTVEDALFWGDDRLDQALDAAQSEPA
jgi:2-hydroxychromene-2-carboxylate isomerase